MAATRTRTLALLLPLWLAMPSLPAHGWGKEKEEPKSMMMPDLGAVLGDSYEVPLELADRAIPGVVLMVTPRGYDPVMKGCVAGEPDRNTMTNVTMQTSLAGGVSVNVGSVGGSASGSASTLVGFIDPEIVGFDLMSFVPSDDCVSKLKNLSKRQPLTDLILVRESLMAGLKGCGKAEAAVDARLPVVGGASASGSQMCELYSNKPIVVGVRTVRILDLPEFAAAAPVAAARAPVPVAAPVSVAAPEPVAARPAAPASGVSGTNTIGMKFVSIAAGSFEMGSPSSEKGRDSDESQHRVRLSKSFLMSTTEVTQGQWQAVMGRNPSHFSSCGADCPVEKVSWFDAVKFANALSKKEGLRAAYRVSGSTVSWDKSSTSYRLPTEAEWEYAARGGQRHVYSGSSTVSEVGWTRENSGNKTHKVAGKRANAWGLYDMTGNLWEWCWDRYGKNYGGSSTDPVGAQSGDTRVFRGGSWGGKPADARVAYRVRDTPDDRGYILGLRLVRTNP